jgi:hypothetical protein
LCDFILLLLLLMMMTMTMTMTVTMMMKSDDGVCALPESKSALPLFES